MGHPGQHSAVQIIAPIEMRGQLSWLYLFFVSIVGAGLGPTAVALLTDYVLRDEAQLRYAMAIVSATLGPLGLYLSYRAMRPYGARVSLIVARERGA